MYENIIIYCGKIVLFVMRNVHCHFTGESLTRNIEYGTKKYKFKKKNYDKKILSDSKEKIKLSSYSFCRS
jgi:hypothetical protein